MGIKSNSNTAASYVPREPTILLRSVSPSFSLFWPAESMVFVLAAKLICPVLRTMPLSIPIPAPIPPVKVPTAPFTPLKVMLLVVMPDATKVSTSCFAPVRLLKSFVFNRLIIKNIENNAFSTNDTTLTVKVQYLQRRKIISTNILSA